MKKIVIIACISVTVLLLLVGCCETTTEYYEVTDFNILPKTGDTAQNGKWEFDITTTDSITRTTTSGGGFCLGDSDDESMRKPIRVVEDIDVFTQTDFSAEYPAGSNINVIINAHFFDNSSNKIVDYNLDDYVVSLLHESNGTARMAYIHNALFSIVGSPDNDTPQQFRLVFTMDDGDTLSVDTPEIVWQD